MFTLSFTIIDVIMYVIVGVPALYVAHDLIKTIRRGGRK